MYDNLTPEQRQRLQDELLAIQVRKATIEVEGLAPNGLKRLVMNIRAFSTSTLAIIAALIGVITGIAGVGFGVRESSLAVRELKVQTTELNNTIHDKQAEITDRQKKIDTQQIQINDKKTEMNGVSASLESMINSLYAVRNAVAKLPESSEKSIITKQLGRLDSNFQYTLTDTTAATNPPPSNQTPTAPMSNLIQELFSPHSAVRIKAYESLISQYGKNPELISALLEHSNLNLGNENGIYNSLVLFSHLNYSTFPDADINGIRSFAIKASENGDRTKERSLKLLARLPK